MNGCARGESFALSRPPFAHSRAKRKGRNPRLAAMSPCPRERARGGRARADGEEDEPRPAARFGAFASVRLINGTCRLSACFPACRTRGHRHSCSIEKQVVEDVNQVVVDVDLAFHEANAGTPCVLHPRTPTSHRFKPAPALCSRHRQNPGERASPRRLRLPRSRPSELHFATGCGPCHTMRL